MTDPNDDRPTPPAAPRARTPRLQGMVNRLDVALLAMPVSARLVGRRLVTVYVVGRRTGRRLAVPVAYTRQGDDLLIGTPFRWARNVCSGQELDVRYRGRLQRAKAEVFTGETDVVRLYADLARDNHNFAGFNRIRLDGSGEPDPQDLHLAWAGGARVLRLALSAKQT